MSGNRGLVDEREASRHLQLGTRAVATGAEEDGGGDGRLLCCRNAPVPQWNLKPKYNALALQCDLCLCAATRRADLYTAEAPRCEYEVCGLTIRCGTGAVPVRYPRRRGRKGGAKGGGHGNHRKVFGSVLVFVVYTGRNSADVDGFLPQTRKSEGWRPVTSAESNTKTVCPL